MLGLILWLKTNVIILRALFDVKEKQENKMFVLEMFMLKYYFNLA